MKNKKIMEVKGKKIVVTFQLLDSQDAFNKVVAEAKTREINQIIVTAGPYYNYGEKPVVDVRIHVVPSSTPSEWWKNHPHPLFGPVFYETMKRMKVEKEWLEKAIQLAEKFLNLGFEATIEESPIGEARFCVKIYEEVIKDGKEKWGPFPGL